MATMDREASSAAPAAAVARVARRAGIRRSCGGPSFINSPRGGSRVRVGGREALTSFRGDDYGGVAGRQRRSVAADRCRCRHLLCRGRWCTGCCETCIACGEGFSGWWVAARGRRGWLLWAVMTSVERGQGVDAEAVAGTRPCLHCGKPVAQRVGAGRPFQYCRDNDDACVKAARNARARERHAPGLPGQVAQAWELVERLDQVAGVLAGSLAGELSAAGVESRVAAVRAEAAAAVAGAAGRAEAAAGVAGAQAQREEAAARAVAAEEREQEARRDAEDALAQRDGALERAAAAEQEAQRARQEAETAGERADQALEAAREAAAARDDAVTRAAAAQDEARRTVVARDAA